jgi:hypothetical protein
MKNAASASELMMLTKSRALCFTHASMRTPAAAAAVAVANAVVAAAAVASLVLLTALLGSSSVPVNGRRSAASSPKTDSRSTLRVRVGAVVMASHALTGAGGGSGEAGEGDAGG